jgi:lysophospholipase L1-like esterase/LysM repeat protein
MNKKYLFLVLFLILGFTMKAQVLDSISFEVDSLAINKTIIIPENTVQNSNGITNFLTKLSELQKTKTGKINIIHIGDSHIQADLMTDKTRKLFQVNFGNAGRGFVFPHSLAHTNGSWDIRFSSKTNWDSYRNIYPVTQYKVGLSGIALVTKSKEFDLELSTKEEGNFFKTIKIITPNNIQNFDVSVQENKIVKEIKIPKIITHLVKRKESILEIANNYHISVLELKRANRLKSNKIRKGRVLKIPNNETISRTIETSEMVPLQLIADANSHYYTFETSQNKIDIFSTKNETEFNLNGIVLENGNPGVLYHNIGVNGAKFLDYNKYPLFFEQLKALNPDLIIVSLGTNESFGSIKTEEYMTQLDSFLKNIKAQIPTTEFLISTPPPSLFKQKFENIFVADYAAKIINYGVENNYTVWDLYAQFGGLFGVQQNYNNGLMANDKVHYSKKGYEQQGELLYAAIAKSLENFQTKK